MQGWIKLHRKSLESSVFSNLITWGVWCWCLMKAGHQKAKFPFNGKDIELYSGQFITGRAIGASECHISEQQWRTAINYLKSTSRITIKSTNKYSIITIQKWNSYQQDNQQTNQPVTNKQPATNQQITTNKNVKNDKNVRSITSNTQSVYGNKEITYLIEYLKEKLELPALDDSILVNRRYCYLLLKKFGNADKVKILIEATAGHDFWSTKIASFKQLYYKAVTIISSTRDKRLEVTKV